MPEHRFGEVRWLASVDSTNRYLLDEARAGAAEGLVVVADHQQAGRGRLGRSWEAPPGVNLLVSVLLRPTVPLGSRHLLSAVVALAAADACRVVAGIDPGVKWPNDLLAPDGRKLAGVLAEADAAGGSEGPAPVVVGIGINVGWPGTDDDLPAELVGRATSLSQWTADPVDRTLLLDRLLDALDPRVTALDSAAGRAAQADELRRRCVTIGSEVRVELAAESFCGVATGVTEEGHLSVHTSGGSRTVVAGDVVHLRPVAPGYPLSVDSGPAGASD